MTTKATGSSATTSQPDSAAIAFGPSSTSPTTPVAAGPDLEAYLGVCPTCLGWHAEADDLDALAEACPTCGERSIEWSLSCQIDREIDAAWRQVRGLAALEDALDRL